MDANGSLDATVTIVPGHLAYMEIPAEKLRNFVDGLFPTLAKNPIADSVSGFGHRYMAGHDMLLDVLKTFFNHGPHEAFKLAGHIGLTDFPTKAGIPIPGLSHTGLGQYLEKAKIHEGWMQVNISDAGVGVIAVAESSTDIALALQGALVMNNAVFFDTFVEGSIEVGFALLWRNPILLAGGVENILAGVGAIWNTMSVYVDPLDFFGAAGMSTLIGFSLAYGLAGENLSDAGKDAIRSGTVGALYTLSPAFGFGALAGFTAYRLGSALAKKHGVAMNACFSIDEQAYRLLVEEICKGNLPVRELLDRASPRLLLPDHAPILADQGNILGDRFLTLSDNCPSLETRVPTLREAAPTLRENATSLQTNATTLLDDPPILTDWYRAAMATRGA